MSTMSIRLPESMHKQLKEFAQHIDEIVQVLDSLLEDDEDEQRETFEFLQQAIDEDRLSSRKRFQIS